jgi:hypothetical protein
MSFFPAKDPKPGDAQAADAIDLVIVPRSADLGHFAVRRALPHVKRRMVGPFIFFDHFGPAEFHGGATARSCIATAWAPPRRSAPARSTG